MLEFLKENPDYIVSVFVLLFTVLGMQATNMKLIILSQIMANLRLGLQCILGGTASTGGVVFLAAVQTVVSFIFASKNKRFPLWLMFTFMAGFSTITVIGFLSPSIPSSPFDLVTMVAVWFFALSIVQSKSYLCRIFSAINVSLWLVYDVCVLPSAVVNHIIILGSIFFSMIINDRTEWKAILRRLFSKKSESDSEKTENN